MNTRLSSMLVVVIAVASGFSSEALAQDGSSYPTPTTHVRKAITTVQTEQTLATRPACHSQRKDVPAGGRVRLYANFFGHKTGVVLLEIGGKSLECRLIDWQTNSVTVDLPLLELAKPENAAITIVLPGNRTAKTFKVRYDPHWIIDWFPPNPIPQPMPPVPAVQGGFTLYGN